MKAKERGHLSLIYLTFISAKIRHVQLIYLTFISRKIRHILAYLSDIQSRRCLADAIQLAPQSAILTHLKVQQIAINNQTKFELKHFTE